MYGISKFFKKYAFETSLSTAIAVVLSPH